MIPKESRLRHIILRSFSILKNEGILGLAKHAWKQSQRGEKSRAGIVPTREEYKQWQKDFEPGEGELITQAGEAEAFSFKPLISIITPVYAVSAAHLAQAVESVCSQTYPHWELVLTVCEDDNPQTIAYLTDISGQDPRIQVTRLAENAGISVNSNQAIQMAKGQYIALLDDDDTLAPWALFEVARLMNTHPEADLIYSDHDLLNETNGTRYKPLFKPDWSPEALLSANYMTHLTVISREMIDSIGGFNPAFDGAQDWDLFLRVTEVTGRIFHIPQILYHWRDHAGSTASNIFVKSQAPEAQKRAIAAHLQRKGLEAVVIDFDRTGFLRAQWKSKPEPVSIIIPSPGIPRHLVECLSSLIKLTAIGNDYEIILVNTGDLTNRDRKELEGMGGGRIKIVDDERRPFNYSASNNLGARNSTSSLLLFINNDIKIIEPDWLSEMALWAQRKEIGAVGARLLYPDGAIQHNGAIIGLDGYAGHVFAGNHPGDWTLMGPTEWYRNYLAVTGACMMVRREVFLQSGGFNEDFELCGGDVDFCLRIRKLGLRNLVTPFARLVHLESRTRKGKPVPKKDYEHSFGIYLPYLEHGDPAFNRNLSSWHSIPQLRKKDEESALRFASKHLDAIK